MRKAVAIALGILMSIIVAIKWAAGLIKLLLIRREYKFRKGFIADSMTVFAFSGGRVIVNAHPVYCIP